MNLREELASASVGHLVGAGLTGAIGLVWWVLRVTFTNQKRIELLEKQGRDQAEMIARSNEALGGRLDKAFELMAERR